MNFLTRAARWLTRAADVEAGWSIVRGVQPAEFQHTGREVRRLGWERNAVVNACARAIADLVAAVDFEVYRLRADGSAQVIAQHDAAALLNTAPRVGMSGYAHRGQGALHYLLYGNSPWVIERGGRQRVSGLRIIHPERLYSVSVNPDGQITRYDWRDTLGQVHETVADDMLHFKDLTASQDGLFGFPRAAAALSDIAADGEATQYVRQVVGNHGVPGLVVATKGYSDGDTLRAAEDRFNERMTARGGRGRTVFVNGEEIQLQQIGFNLRDLEFPDLRAIAREDICTSFNVDPRMVGIGSATAGTNGGLSGVQFREARFRHIQQAVIPVMKAFEAELNRWLMPEYGEVLIRFRPDTLSELTEDEATTSARIIAEVAAKVRTIEEARETIGLSSVIDPTHHFAGPDGVTLAEVGVALEQAALSPVDKAQAMTDALPPPPPVPALPPGNAPPPAGKEPPAKEPPVVTARAMLAPPVHRAQVMPEADRVTAWQRFDAQATQEEPSFLHRLHDLFSGEWTRLAALFAVAGTLDAAASAILLHQIAALYASTGPFQAAWAEAMRTPIRDTLVAGARQAILEGPPGAADLPMTRLTAAARTRAQELAGHVVQTTFDQIRGLLAVAQHQGLNPRDTAALIHDTVFGPAVDSRTSLIARTEIAGALNHGAYLAAVDGRQVQSKMWITERDDRVRPAHTHAEAQGWIPVEKAFGNGLQYPGDPMGGLDQICNCRCTLAFSDAATGAQRSTAETQLLRTLARIADRLDAPADLAAAPVITVLPAPVQPAAVTIHPAAIHVDAPEITFPPPAPLALPAPARPSIKHYVFEHHPETGVVVGAIVTEVAIPDSPPLDPGEPE